MGKHEATWIFNLLTPGGWNTEFDFIIINAGKFQVDFKAPFLIVMRKAGERSNYYFIVLNNTSFL